MRNWFFPATAAAALLAYWLWSSAQPQATSPTQPLPTLRQTPTPASPRSADDRDEPATAASARQPRPPRDRVHAEQVRRQLRDRLHRANAAPPADRDDAPADQAEAAPPALSPEYIQQRIRDDLVPIAQECYESALEDDPKLTGTLTLSFTILGDRDVGGVVDEATVAEGSTLDQPDLVECVRASMLSVEFEPPNAAGLLQVTYPFRFTPEASDSGPADESAMLGTP